MMRKLTLFCAVLAAMICATQAIAIPAKPGKIERVQPDGSTVTVTLRGDEYCHAFFSEDGYMLMERENALYYAIAANNGFTSSNTLAHNEHTRSATEKDFVATLSKVDFAKFHNSVASERKKALKKVSGDDFPAFGDMRGIVLLVNFQNLKMLPQHDLESWQRLMNEKGTEIFESTGSCADYFSDQSMGLFTPTFDVVGPIELDNKFEYYGHNDSRGQDTHPQDMVKEACEKAHNDFGVDFSNYDYDENGYVDFVYVFYAGFGEASGANPSTIWPHSSDISVFGIDLELDGKKITSYACSNELYGNSGEEHDGIGAFCHEFSHVLGLPDMYNTKNTADVQIGTWELMDKGSYNNRSRTPPAYSAYERLYLGWLNVTELSEPAYGVELPELTKNNFAYIIRTKNDNEYFILENRQQRGWDKYHYSTGMLAYHVLYDESLWKTNNVNSGLFPHYDLLEADGLSGGYGAAFPGPTGSTMLTDYSKPANMMLWDGTAVDKGLSNIAERDNLITFDFMHDRYRTVALKEVTNITDRSFVVNWEPAPEYDGYRVDLKEVLSEEENPILINEGFDSMSEYKYPFSGYEDLGGVLDDYTEQPGWVGLNVFDSGSCVRVGGYGVSGFITTPLFDTSRDQIITLALRSQSYPGKSVNVAIDFCDENDNVLETYTYKGNKTEAVQVINFTNLGGNRYLKISTTNERIFVHDLRVLHGDVKEEDVWTVGPKSWSVFADADDHCLIDGLRPQHTYLFSVVTLAEEEMKSSNPTETVSVTTLEGTGVGTIDADSDAPTECFDLMGRKMPSSAAPGMYITRKGNEIRKLIINQ